MQTLSLACSDSATLPELAKAISAAHECCEKTKKVEQTVAQRAIDAAFQCGRFLRQAKKMLGHGEYERWIRRTQKFTVRTAQNYTRFHKWALVNQLALINSNPHSLRQAYILSGILPEDESKELPDGKPDELAGVKRQAKKLCNQVAAHRDYAETKKLQKALEKVKRMIEDVYEGLENYEDHEDYENRENYDGRWE